MLPKSPPVSSSVLLNDEILQTICAMLDKRNLRAMSLVSTSWRYPAQAALFRDIIIIDYVAVRNINNSDYCRPDLMELFHCVHRSIVSSTRLANAVEHFTYHPLRKYNTFELFRDIVTAATSLISFTLVVDGAQTVNVETAGRYREIFNQATFTQLTIYTASLDGVACVPARRLSKLKLIGTGAARNSAAQGPAPLSGSEILFNADTVIIHSFREHYRNGLGVDAWRLSTILRACLFLPQHLAIIHCPMTWSSLERILIFSGSTLKSLWFQRANTSTPDDWNSISSNSYQDNWAKLVPQLVSLTSTGHVCQSLHNLPNLERLTLILNGSGGTSLQRIVSDLGHSVPNLDKLRLIRLRGDLFRSSSDRESSEGVKPNLISSIEKLVNLCKQKDIKLEPAGFLEDYRQLQVARTLVEKITASWARTTLDSDTEVESSVLPGLKIDIQINPASTWVNVVDHVDEVGGWPVEGNDGGGGWGNAGAGDGWGDAVAAGANDF